MGVELAGAREVGCPFALAAAAYERLAASQLFHLDAEAAGAAVDVELRVQSLTELAPAPCGLLGWQELPYAAGGILIRAAS